MLRALTTLTFCIALLTGCVTSPAVRSTTSGAAVQGAEIGVYYLPRKLVRVHLRFNAAGELINETGEGAIAPLTELMVHGKAYRLYHTRANNFSDNVKIETVDGFLSKVTNTSEDQRPSTIEAIAKAIPEIIPAPGATAPAERGTRRPNLLIDVLVDPHYNAQNPAGPMSPEAFNAKYSSANGIAFQSMKLSTPADLGTAGTDSNDGVVFPLAEHYRFVLEIGGENGAAGNSFALDTLVPSDSKIARLDVSRTAWAKHVTTLEFDNGIFKTASVDRGSVTAAVAMIPINILKAIFSIPTELVQFRINHLSGSKETIAAQQSLIDAQKALLVAQEQLDAEKKKAGDGGSTDAPKP